MINETAINLTFLRPLAIKKSHLLVLEILGAIIALFLLAFYILQVQAAAKDNFDISIMEQRLLQERSEIQGLEITFSRLNSSTITEASLSGSNYKKSDRVYYIQTPDTAVAYEPN